MVTSNGRQVRWRVDHPRGGKERGTQNAAMISQEEAHSRGNAAQ
jgi:hypothetical protein